MVDLVACTQIVCPVGESIWCDEIIAVPLDGGGECGQPSEPVLCCHSNCFPTNSSQGWLRSSCFATSHLHVTEKHRGFCQKFQDSITFLQLQCNNKICNPSFLTFSSIMQLISSTYSSNFQFTGKKFFSHCHLLRGNIELKEKDDSLSHTCDLAVHTILLKFLSLSVFRVTCHKMLFCFLYLFSIYLLQKFISCRMSIYE